MSNCHPSQYIQLVLNNIQKQIVQHEMVVIELGGKMLLTCRKRVADSVNNLLGRRRYLASPAFDYIFRILGHKRVTLLYYEYIRCSTAS